MNGFGQPRIVLDTNVVFEGLTKRDSFSGLLIDYWFAGVVQVAVSDSLAYEYVAVLSRKLSRRRWQQTRIALANLLRKANQTVIYFSWRPSSPDPGDEMVIDCAMNANAILVTLNVRDFRLAQQELGLRVMTPMLFVLNWGKEG
ncbi:MAG: putative toxin-antitoxin system toxin component, PIN family [Anaerolineales bacterium]|nr:putative toxin-antitoxin system toxin component, PIN family [Anaerolineales bacterium]